MRETFGKLEDAYEILIDPQKRAVYDLLGREGLGRELGWDGTLGIHGPNRDQMVGIRAMDTEEFKAWCLETMQKQERQILESMVEHRVRDPAFLSVCETASWIERYAGCGFLTPLVKDSSHNSSHTRSDRHDRGSARRRWCSCICCHSAPYESLELQRQIELQASVALTAKCRLQDQCWHWRSDEPLDEGG